MGIFYPSWIWHRFGLPFLVFVPWGWQGEFGVDVPQPQGISLPEDLDMAEETTDGKRLRDVTKPQEQRWKHQAVVRVKGGKRRPGFLCYHFPDSSWRIRVRIWRDQFDVFKVYLSRQETRLALVDPTGKEIELEVIERSINPWDERYLNLPVY